MKQNIINEAIPLFIQFGFKSVTIDDIAIKMGVSKKTIYAHFPKKVTLVETSVFMHFNNVLVLRKKLEEAMKATDDFGRDARSITRTLENIKNSSSSDDDDDPDSPTPVSAYGQVSEGKH